MLRYIVLSILKQVRTDGGLAVLYIPISVFGNTN